MFQHDKKLLQDVKVERPNGQYAVLMQEQLGGANGELKAATLQEQEVAAFNVILNL